MYGIVYRIRSPSLGKDYYGSFLGTKEKRWGNHLRDYKLYKRGVVKGYTTACELIEAGDAFIKVLEEKKDWKDKEELRWRERWYYDNFECVNIQRPIQSEEELKEYCRNWKKQKINSSKEFWERSKLIQREHYQRHRQKIIREKKIYYKENKEKITARKNERMLCDICGDNSSRGEMSGHKKSKKCRSILLNPFSNAFDFF